MARPTSKYEGLFHKLKLPKIVPSDLRYQERVDLMKAELRQERPTAISKAEYYMILRGEKTRIEEELAGANLLLEACTQLLVESQENNQDGWGKHGAPRTGLRMADGALISVRSEPYSTVSDHDAIRRYFFEQGMESALKPHWSTVDSLNKERLMNGESELPGTSVFIKSKIVYRKGKDTNDDED